MSKSTGLRNRDVRCFKRINYMKRERYLVLNNTNNNKILEVCGGDWDQCVSSQSKGREWWC